MTKKITVIILVFSLITLAGCVSTSEFTKEERFDMITESSNEVTYMDLTMTGNIIYEVISPDMTEPMVMDMVTTQDLKMDMSDVNNVKTYQKIHMEGMGQEMDMTLFILDSVIYIETQGVKMKMPASIEDLEEIQKAATPLIINSSDLDELIMEKDGDTYVLTYSVSPDKLENYQEFFDTLINSIELGTGLEMEFDYLSGSYTVLADNTMISATMDMGMTMAVEGVSISAEAKMDNIYNSFNKPLTIEYPNLEEYKE